MLEDRIIVQDRGIDAGLAALMQNANKGMDPAALMAMMNMVTVKIIINLCFATLYKKMYKQVTYN